MEISVGVTSHSYIYCSSAFMDKLNT